MDARRVRTVLVLLGLALVAGAALAKLVDLQGRAAEAPATVRVDVTAPDGSTLFNRTVSLARDDAYVLPALLRAAEAEGIPVKLEDYGSLGVMVVAIGPYRNQGACGWVYEVSGASGDRSASLYPVRDGDRTHWFWTCHGA